MVKSKVRCNYLYDFYWRLTRLTNSGLSIAEWKPVTGILPPLTEASWISEFDKYKQTPKYIKVNNNMNLAEFKSIFWLEFIHRIEGRITGILYIIPLMYFLFNKPISSKKIYIYLIGFILLISQGFAGLVYGKKRSYICSLRKPL